MQASRLVLGAFVASCASSAQVSSVPSIPPAPPQPQVAIVQPSPPALRLPTFARPVRYDLDLWLDPHRESMRGRVGIDLAIAEPTRVLWLNATALVVDQATLTTDGSTAPLVAQVIPGGDDFVGFAFDHELAPGKARLSVTYHGAIDSERSRGIYAVREGDDQPYLYTFFETIDARRAFPCFDEPAYKVPWKVSLHVPAEDVAAGNAPTVREVTEEGGKVVELAETKPLPSYLVAFVVGPFDVVDAGTAGHFGTPLRFIAPRGRGGETAYAASVTPKIISLLEDYFGMPYPYGKLDVAVVPRFWGTMEHPGIVALGQPLTLMKHADENVQRKIDYVTIAAHELSHYWFGDYVTTAWWDDAWLNEAMGEWMHPKVTAGVDPAWHYGLESTSLAFRGMRADALTTARRMRQEVASKSDIESAFDNDITYFKGQAVLGMFEGWMTPERYQRAMRSYMSAHAFGSATASDVFSALEAEQPGAGSAIRTFIDQPGVPIIGIETVCQGGRSEVSLTQARYLPSGAHAEAETWKIPVCIRYERKGAAPGRSCTLLEGAHVTLPLDAPSCPAWVVGNADATGYYHVAYTDNALRAVLAHASGISVAERVDALGDAAALVDSGRLSASSALAFVADATKSRERYMVWAGMTLARLAREAAMSDQQAEHAMRFLHAVYGPLATELGLVRRTGDTIDGELLRPDVVWLAAVDGQDAALRTQAHDLAFSWLRDPATVAGKIAERSVPDPEHHGGLETVLAAAARTNDARLFAAILDKAKVEPDHVTKGRLLVALGGFTSPELARRAEAVVVDPAFDIRESIGILGAQLETRATRAMAWEFLKASFDAMTPRMRSDDAAFFVSGLASAFCDETHGAEVKAFFEPRAAKIDGMAYVVATTVESIHQCAAGFKANQVGVDGFLARY
jgi:aminopeptidase N